RLAGGVWHGAGLADQYGDAEWWGRGNRGGGPGLPVVIRDQCCRPERRHIGGGWMGGERGRGRVGGRIRPADPGRIARRNKREPERSDWRLLGVVSGYRDRYDASFSVAVVPEGVERDEQNDQADEQ